MQIKGGKENLERASYRRLHTLRAGEVRAELDGVDLRYLRIGSVEIVRRIYIAVRDPIWETIQPEISGLEIEGRDDRFSVSFRASHRRGEIDFHWHGTITGSSDGSIAYRMDGMAGADFRYNRIGLCVLHPPRESAGRPYRGETPDGAIEGTLPLLIGPQRFERGVYLGLFPPVSRLEIELEAGGHVDFAFEGDLFELEDQRNWTDASFKAYSTPLALGFPRQAKAGQRIRQAVCVRAVGVPVVEESEGPVRITLGRGLGRSLPAIGLGMASHGDPLTPREIELLRALFLDHLRVDLHLGREGWEAELGRAAEACSALGCALELALFLTEDEQPLERLAHLLAGGPAVARSLVFGEGAQLAAADETTPAALVRLARRQLGGPVAGGTDFQFAELNRTRPEIESMDAVCWPISAQVHAFDDLSVMETLEAQADTVRTARSFAGGLPLVVSPITLRRRANPRATGAEPSGSPSELPAAVDPRQASQLAAAWMLGSVKYLAEAGAASLSYFETTGWRGVVERAQGSPLPERFPSSAGEPFPLYRVLVELASLKSAELLECETSAPLKAVGLALGDGETTQLLLANLSASDQVVEVDGGLTVQLDPYDVKRIPLQRSC